LAYAHLDAAQCGLMFTSIYLTFASFYFSKDFNQLSAADDTKVFLTLAGVLLCQIVIALSSLPITQERKTSEETLIEKEEDDTSVVFYKSKTFEIRTKFWYVWLITLIVQVAIVIGYFASSKVENIFTNVWLVISTIIVAIVPCAIFSLKIRTRMGIAMDEFDYPTNETPEEITIRC
jgi:hypothetical protein